MASEYRALHNHTDARGLTHSEVAKRIERGEVNRTEKFTTRTLSGIFGNNFLTLFNAILSGAVIALVFIGAFGDAAFLLIVTLINSLVGTIGEWRAKLALDKLALMAPPSRAMVVREGRNQEIAADEVVKDDLIILGRGEQIIVDGILASDSPLFIDESLVTGEAATVIKRQGDPLASGSFCVKGSGTYLATHVGREASVNILTAKAKSYKITRTPLQNDINIFIQVLSAAMVLFILLLIMAGHVKQIPLAATILSIATVIKSFVPEGLVLVSTLAFALGALRAAKNHVLVQKLNAVESMGQLTTLCLDKTGTLGTNRLKFETLYILSESQKKVARQIGLFVGALTEKNQTALAIEAQFPAIASTRLDEILFSSVERVSAVQIRDQEKELSLWLGAPEVLAKGRLTSAQETFLKKLHEQGLRVLIFARGEQSLPKRENIVLLAFIVLKDELRPYLKQAIEFYESRNVALKILSGDNPETVMALARQAGISVEGETVNGQDLAGQPQAHFAAMVHKGQFFGRVLPEQKKQIIQCLQDAGEFVGMIGDGVNDVLALKQADIGIAMNSGAPATRDVSDIILLKDTFAHLPSLSQEGDQTIYNIKRIARLFLTKNIYSILYILFVGFIGLDFPLNPRLITWIDVLTIGIPVALLTLMRPALNKQTTTHFLRETIGFAALAGIVIAFFSLFVYADFSLFQDNAESFGATAALSVIVIMGLYVVFHVTSAERAPSSPKIQQFGAWAILLFVPLFHILMIYWPLIRDTFGMVSLDADSWLTIILASALGITLLHLLLQHEFRKRLLGI